MNAYSCLPFKRQPHKIVKNTLKQFVGNHFVGLALKVLTTIITYKEKSKENYPSIN